MRSLFLISTLIILIVSPALAQDWTLNAFLKHDGDIEGVAFSEKGRTLASMGGDGVLHYWDPDTEEVQSESEISLVDRWSIDASIVPEEPHTQPVNTFDILRRTVSFPGVEDPTGLLATGSSDQSIWLQGFPTLRPLFRIQEQGEVYAVALSPDGRLLASSGNFAGIHLWDLTTISPDQGTIELRDTLGTNATRIEGLAFSPDGQTLAAATGSSSGEAIHLWDIRTRQRTETLIAVGVPVTQVTFSPDGQMIVGGARHTFGGRNVLLWKRGPLSPAKIPHSVEIAGPGLVTALNKDFIFTVTVKNRYGHPLKNVVATLNNPGSPNDWEHDHSVGVWTDGEGKAPFTLRFYDAGHHDIDASVLDRATREASLTQQFVDRVEVPEPHSITPEKVTYDSIVIPPTSNTATYEDTFMVKSVEGLALQGFQVGISADGVSGTDWTDELGNATGSLDLPAGIFDVDVTVLDFRGTKVWLEKTFSNRVKVYPSHTCSAIPPSEEVDALAREIEIEIQKLTPGPTYLSLTGSSSKPTTSFDTRYRWRPGHTFYTDLGVTMLAVEFIGGSDEERKRVIKAAKEWSQAANIGFLFFSDPDKRLASDIRVRFPDDKINASTLGTHEIKYTTGQKWGFGIKHILAIPGNILYTFGVVLPNPDIEVIGKEPSPSEIHQGHSEYTMTLGTEDEGFSYGTALHEFGHALGFHHSHKVPEFPGKFDEAEAIKYFGSRLGGGGGGAKEVEHNVLTKVQLGPNSSFDPDSIMIYNIPPSVLSNKEDYPKGFPAQRSHLSEGDKRSLQIGYGERRPDNDYLYIPGKVHYFTTGEDFVGRDFACTDEVKNINLFVRQQSDEYIYSFLPNYVCDSKTDTRVSIHTRGIVQLNGVDHLEMKARVDYYANTITPSVRDRRDSSKTKTFRLPLDGNTHFFQFPRLEDDGIVGSSLGGSLTNVTLELRAANPRKEPEESEPIILPHIIFPHRTIYRRFDVAAPQALITNQVIPEQTELLANYPNPFNPETWIPYQLAKPAEVTLDIYSADGELIRTLVLGYQSAGTYHSKSQAAYWDGRNELGEPVASGVYFYVLRAGEFIATRKMLIIK